MKILKKVQKVLYNYYSYFKDDVVLVLSEDKSLLPFAYVLCDVAYPGFILVSFAVDYPFSSKAAQIVLDINKLLPTLIMEDFYIAKNGTTFWGEEALKMYEIDSVVDLEEIEPVNEELM